MDFAESLTAVLGEGSNVCLSGGADGADLQWGLQAGKADHYVIHWSFAGHRTQAPTEEVVRLTQEQLNLADDALTRANRTLKRRWPTRTDVTNNLLRRNWYQIKDAGSLYAISEMGLNGEIAGGTAWAVQMYLDRFIHDGEPMENCRAYVLDKNTLHWYKWTGAKWELIISRPPKPTGIWAGVGSREISALVRVEVRKLMGTFVLDEQQVASIHPIIEEPKLNDVIYVPDLKLNGQNLLGGWATVTRITKGITTWIYVGESSANNEFDWNELKEQQIELRKKFGLVRASSKPSYS